MVSYLLYVSSATHRLGNEELTAILEQYREKTARSGISGLLLYRDGNFMHYLEGSTEALADLHAEVLADPRQKQVIVLLRGESEEPMFAQWAMSVQDGGKPGEAGQAVSPCLSEISLEELCLNSPHPAIKLMLSFKRLMR